MASLIAISDPDDPRVAVFRDQRDQWVRARHRHWMEGGTGEPPRGTSATGLDPAVDPAGDLFIAEGDKVVSQLLDSPHETLSVLVAEHRLERHRPIIAAVPDGVPVYVLARDHADRLAGYPIHRGLMAAGRRRDPGPLAGLLRSSACCVICEDLANHDNVGSIFRSVRALAPARDGFEHPACVLLTPRCCDPLYRKALRVSMGNALHVPWATIEPWPGKLAAVAEAGFEVIALDPGAGSVEIGRVPSGRPAFVLGTEGEGLSEACREQVGKIGGYLGRIPINPAADSLNVAVACAIALDRALGGH